MVGMFDRYFQIARCYRNEGTKADRQPEFTQVDIELSFTTVKDIQNLIEKLIKYSWPPEKGDIKIPFTCLKYDDAIHYYGTDKPDLRYEMKWFENCCTSNSDPDFISSCLVIPHGSKLLKNREIRDIQKSTESVAFIPISVKDDFTWSSSISKHINVETQQNISQKLICAPGDLILLAIGKSMPTRTFLGKTRVRCAEYLQSIGVDIIRSNILSFVWITDFPLFLQNEDGILESAHHPFTAPHAEDIDLIYSNPSKARSLHYDLVLNGQEIGGGSIRIHDANLQKFILEDVLKEDPTDLQHLLDALHSGCPPHGGIALGIDRMLAIMCGCQSITEVIAFPKSLDGKDLMSGAPCSLSSQDKVLYHIEPILPKQ
ncbi:aspartate--tRNA ligase, mitochondrial [Trichonephila clavata]|uniref:Aspartate--tRNA ligase, mitochondrial n=1 Tax=Trichonephila clavata TaxID=2740835 RepID=A0A8X6HM49_TRICU|nr:aspartate--tRNA ligase, mitochondrial [Trichonephila clavata]